ncbi:TetR family transcriptional regulator [Chryseobacterium mucoviscidosis]|uniref:TetR/AcrR family transcriptional regulator n=1 Tax=unclassified Paenibacillus TaxID=185978 RepID=UPI0009A2EB0C|nr:TetR/AcrR family transcriptional regulator [Paenibacillus sp. 11B]MDN8587642.1 TetR/AcrR family transcriptional regulator [Paenibacillus sp. 11B]OPG96018.1 TetR family transcriptional regulator [Chryseobacterium mucoviscidosis]
MPKIVDHEKQRIIVADAAIRVIRDNGLDHATVRNIAKEAGLSVGSMRHYFATQAELFAFCMNLFAERVQQRVEALQMTDSVLQNMKHLLFSFLPLDEERKIEMEVWFSFSAKVLVYPELQKLSDQMHQGMYRSAQLVIQELQKQGMTCTGMDTEIETEKLYALIDGLAIHMLMQPERLTVKKVENVIEQHLSMLCHA